MQILDQLFTQNAKEHLGLEAAYHAGIGQRRLLSRPIPAEPSHDDGSHSAVVGQ